jgi:PIN domain nuclease of toxin-antitoxin system
LLPRLLLDTQIVLRWLADDKKLSREQRRVLDRAVERRESFAVSAISLLEIASLARRGRIDGMRGAEEVFQELQNRPIFVILPLTYDIALEAASFADGLRDPADSVIVATARVHCLRLITSDQRIIESKLVPVVE